MQHVGGLAFGSQQSVVAGLESCGEDQYLKGRCGGLDLGKCLLNRVLLGNISTDVLIAWVNQVALTPAQPKNVVTAPYIMLGQRPTQALPAAGDQNCASGSQQCFWITFST